MSIDTSSLSGSQRALLDQLAQSHDRLLTHSYDEALLAKLRQIADEEASLLGLLYPMPLDPAGHILATHAIARPYLERLTRYDGGRLVVADETHSYTPRKILRRVLDHALDHLNQIEQWLNWQSYGRVPTPTDGWATSEQTFPEDLQPLSQEELQAWLWRIDITVNMIAQRAQQLTEEQLAWIPPGDGAWPLKQALHHLALSELYYVTWIEEPLPDEALARYNEANTRFVQRLYSLWLHPVEAPSVLFDDSGASTTTAEQLVQQVLELEQTLFTE